MKSSLLLIMAIVLISGCASMGNMSSGASTGGTYNASSAEDLAKRKERARHNAEAWGMTTETGSSAVTPSPGPVRP